MLRPNGCGGIRVRGPRDPRGAARAGADGGASAGRGGDLRHEVAPARPAERHNLPVQLTSLVGREAELADGERLLGDARLVTPTGVGGAGKTRRALEEAAYFEDGRASYLTVDG